MKNIQSKYPLFLVIFSSIVLLVSWLGNNYIPLEFKYENFTYLLSYYFAFTYIILGILFKSAVKSPQKFVNTFMIITTCKLLINGMIAVIFAFTNRPEAKGFLVFFLAYYLLYTGFEVLAITAYKSK
ncbi:MAG: hypothetical protein WCK02_06425 [Bacteroidota bacterium]